MDEISAYTEEQLIAALKHNGLSVGPLTATTRRIYEKRLYRKLHPDESDGAAAAQGGGTTTTEKTTEAVSTLNGLPPAGSTQASEKTEGSKINLPTSYFGVQLPENIDEVDGVPECSVFDDKIGALKVMKKFPGSRFKVFSTKSEAEDYSKLKVQTTQEFKSPKPNGNLSQLKPGSPMPKEGSVFKGPKPQELVIFRKAIEANDLVKVKSMAWSNPRYLISSVDTPTVLQEGFHYNALHVTANKDRPEICRYILDTLENPDFLMLIYPADTQEIRLNRMSFLVDLYLNTPDSSKGNCETPLHFACKFGNADVVEVLTSHPKTDRVRKNKYGESPLDVVCTRMRTASLEIKERIFDLLEDSFYVPLLRTTDNSSPALVAKPWSPSVEKDSGLCEPQPVNLMYNSPTEAPLAVKAFAGPMSPSQADKFRRRWLTPPSPSLSDRRRYQEIRRSDCEKGYERIGRNLAQDMRVPWSEFWPFLEDFADFSSGAGLKKLENYLQEQAKDATGLASLDNALQMIESQFRQLELNPHAQDAARHVISNNKMAAANATNNNGADLGGGGAQATNAALICDIQLDGNSKPAPNSTVPLDFKSTPPKLLPGSFQTSMDRQSSEGESSMSSAESYQTAVEELDMDFADAGMSTPPRDPAAASVFVLGEEPTKADVDVLRAVEDSPITPENYPYINHWKNLVLSYSEQARKSWRSPLRTRATRSTPRRLLEGQPSHMTSTPHQSSPLTLDTTGLVRSPPDVASDSDSVSSMDDSLPNDSFRHVRTNLLDSFSRYEQ